MTTETTTADLFQIADRLRALRDRKDGLNATLREVEDNIKTVERELSDAMAEAECQNFTRGDKMFILTTKSYWSAAEGCIEALYNALRENGYGHLFTVHSQTLASFLRDTVSATEDENGETSGPGWLAGLIRNYDKAGITVKSAAKK
jgi:hypothetical protein